MTDGKRETAPFPVPRFPFPVAIALAAATLCCIPAAAQYPVIQLQAIHPTAVQAGSTAELRVATGQNIEQVDRLVFSDDRITAEIVSEPAAEQNEGDEAAEPTPKFGHFRVTVPDDLPAGRYEVFAAGADGVSNPRILEITSHRVVAIDPAEASTEPPSLTEHLKSEEAITFLHRATPANIDRFRFSLPPKRSMRLVALAQGIDSRMIPQLLLFDSSGKQIASARGGDGLDPAINLPADAGDLVLAVHDFLYRGGETYFYQLRFEPEPADEETSFLSDEPGTFAQLESVSIRSAGELTPLPHANAAEPLQVTPPCVVDSQFDPSASPRVHEDHEYRFDAQAGQKWMIEVVSHRAGLPTDPRLTVQRLELKDDGSEVWHAVAAADDPPLIGDAWKRIRSKDPVLEFTAPADATYRIAVRNLDTGTSLGSDRRYRLMIREPKPDFRLVAMPQVAHREPIQTRPAGSLLLHGDASVIRVTAVRRDGFAEPILVSAEGLPDGVTARPVRIAANQSFADLVVHADETAEDWIGELRVVGRPADAESSDTDDAKRKIEAAAATCVHGAGEQRDFLQTRLSSRLMIAVSGRQVPLTVGLGDDSPAEAKPGAGVTLSIRLTRRDGAAGPVTLRPRNLPPGVTAGEVTVAADKSEATVELKVAGDAKPGRYSLWFQGETRVKFQPPGHDAPQDITVFVPSNTADLIVAEAS